MHPRRPHRLSPSRRTSRLHRLFHHRLPSSSLARVQQNPFLHRLAFRPQVVANFRVRCTRPHLHAHAHRLPHRHPFTLSRIALVHHAHHRHRPRTSVSHRVVALVLFRHFPAMRNGRARTMSVVSVVDK